MIDYRLAYTRVLSRWCALRVAHIAWPVFRAMGVSDRDSRGLALGIMLQGPVDASRVEMLRLLERLDRESNHPIECHESSTHFNFVALMQLAISAYTNAPDPDGRPEFCRHLLRMADARARQVWGYERQAEDFKRDLRRARIDIDAVTNLIVEHGLNVRRMDLALERPWLARELWREGDWPDLPIIEDWYDALPAERTWCWWCPDCGRDFHLKHGDQDGRHIVMGLNRTGDKAYEVIEATHEMARRFIG